MTDTGRLAYVDMWWVIGSTNITCRLELQKITILPSVVPAKQFHAFYSGSYYPINYHLCFEICQVAIIPFIIDT
ncbi:hypothetical protein SCA6_001159 [Theobroma cacao]